MTLPRTLDEAVTSQSALPRHDPTSQVARVLSHLKLYGRITNIELIQHYRILRGSERIRELKDEGWVIRSIKLNRTTWVYILDGHQDDLEDQS